MVDGAITGGGIEEKITALKNTTIYVKFFFHSGQFYGESDAFVHYTPQLNISSGLMEPH